jgi:hypothetical protein
MKNTLVRKFQLPTASEPSAESSGVKPATAANAPPVDSPPVSDVEIPEINTNFIDNLFTDPTFVDRFDVAFGQTVPMGLDQETKQPAKRLDPNDSGHDWPDMLDISFTKPKSE